MIHFFLSSVPPLLRQTKERGRRVKTARPITGLGLLKPRNYSSAQTCKILERNYIRSVNSRFLHPVVMS